MEVQRRSSTLPARLIDQYRTSKQDTNTVIRWMCSHASPKRRQCANIHAVDDLSFIADELLERNIHIPHNVIHSLRSAIRVRARLSKYFEGFQGDAIALVNENHQYFNEILSGIYHRMRTKIQTAAWQESSSHDLSIPVSNRFECLHAHADRRHGSIESFSSRQKQQDRLHAREQVKSVEKVTIQEAESSNTRSRELSVKQLDALTGFLDRFKSLFDTTSRIWAQKADRSKVSIVSATVATNTALDLAKKYESCLHIHGIEDPDQLKCIFEDCLRTLGYSQDSPHIRPHLTTLLTITRVWHVLQEFRSRWLVSAGAKTGSRSTVSEPRNIPCDDISKLLAASTSDSTDDELLQQILQRMSDLIFFQQTNGGLTISIRLTFKQTPLVELLSLFLLEKYDRARFASTSHCSACSVPKFALCFGLLMLTQTTHLMSSQNKTATQSWRLHTLRLANDIKKDLASLMESPHTPCGCLRIHGVCIADELKNEYSRITKFLSTKRFDAFHLTPWLSGANALEMLVNNIRCGWYAWHHAYFVGRTLYLYQCLVLLGVISPQELALFEQLCAALIDPVFLGARPKRSLWTTYQRWKGGRIDRQRGHGTSAAHACATQQGRKRWGLKCPEDASQGGNSEKRRFEPRRKSLTIALSLQSYRLDDDPWKDLTAHQDGSQTVRTKSKQNLADSSPEPRILDEINEAVQKELHGDFPLLKLNPYAVYEVCVDVLSKINRSEHTDQDPSICPCVMERLLCATDVAIAQDPCSVYKMREGKLLRHVKEAFIEGMRGRSIDDFCWRNELL